MSHPKQARSGAQPAVAAEPQPHVYGEGRQKLLKAAARLAASHGHTGFSLRELAREAGLGHNSVYRHFESVDALMAALVGDFHQALRSGLSQARRRVPAGQPPSKTVVPWLFDFAQANRDMFVVSMRERFRVAGESAEWVEQGLRDIESDMLREWAQAGRIPSPVPEVVAIAVRMIMEQSFLLCLECIHHPERREALLHRAEMGYQWILGGAMQSLKAQSR
jgi:TetR/AcrR family transcriptional regulator, fatty acid biosynthesis regulator